MQIKINLPIKFVRCSLYGFLLIVLLQSVKTNIDAYKQTYKCNIKIYTNIATFINKCKHFPE